MEKQKTKVLFVCAANYGRSPTAMDLVNTLNDGFEAKSCGIFVGAVVEVSRGLLDWADTIFVMENYMKEHLGKYVNPEKIIVLDIPDKYAYASKNLINLLAEKLLPFGIDTTRAKDNFKNTRALWHFDYDDTEWL